MGQCALFITYGADGAEKPEPRSWCGIWLCTGRGLGPQSSPFSPPYIPRMRPLSPRHRGRGAVVETGFEPSRLGFTGLLVNLI